MVERAGWPRGSLPVNGPARGTHASDRKTSPDSSARRVASMARLTPSINAASQPLQEAFYGEGYDYRRDSPHLKHRQLNERLLALLRATLSDLGSRDQPLTVLEIGAGDGAFVEPLLAFGCEVTATEMSKAAIAHLLALYGNNPRFRAVFDQDASLTALGEDRYSLILYASVLHHIPDYCAAIDLTIRSRLSRGGSFVSLQDPLRYATMPKGVHTLSEAAFLSWRVGQGNLLRGVRSRLRHARDAYEDDNPSDVVEYHVVRDGVDEQAIARVLSPHFASVTMIPYWSTFAKSWQLIGDRFSIANTFSIRADEYLDRGPGAPIPVVPPKTYSRPA